jgi:hopene-associated glycosyltransferase HpnB
MFWRVAPLLRIPVAVSYDQPARVAAIIPARDEEDVLGAAIDSLKRQQFTGELRVFVVDDNSSDDIEHEPASLRNLIAHDLPMASVMVRLRCESVAERLLVPAFVFFFFKLYPPSWIADPRARTAGAAGGCILIRADMLERIGGIDAIRSELIDDCALAKAVKKHGPIWLGMSDQTRSLRAYGSFASVWNMVARTAFTQLGHSSLLLTGTMAGMSLTYIAPVIFTIAGSAVAFAAWICLSVAYVPMLRFYAQPLWMAPLLPLIALFYLGATVHSAVRYWAGSGGQWKGRVQDRRQ